VAMQLLPIRGKRYAGHTPPLLKDAWLNTGVHYTSARPVSTCYFWPTSA